MPTVLDIVNDRFLEEQVSEPTQITEHSSNISSSLDMSFTNNSSLINSTEVMPGISDHYTVYTEAILHPHKAPTSKCKVFLFSKANSDEICNGLHEFYAEMSTLQHQSADSL